MKAVIIGASGHIDLALSVRGRLPGLSFVGIAPGSPEEDTRGFFIEQMEPALIPFYDDYRAMLDRERPDVAVVAPYFYLQARVACECLERGVNVFVEKPMAPSLQELDRLRLVHARSGKALCPMLPSRYRAEFTAAHRAVKEGLIGEPLLITARKSYKLGLRNAMFTRRSSYGGTIPWAAFPAIDWVYWFCGGRILEVSASHTTEGNRGHGELESSGVCFFRLANSGAAAVSFDYLRPSAAPGHGEDELRVAGEKGVLEVAGAEATVVTDSSGPRSLPRKESKSIFEEFVLSLSGETAMEIGAGEAFDVSELALKSREAADTRRAVAFHGT